MDTNDALEIDIDDGERSPLIKPGNFKFSFRYHETVRLFGGTKAVFWFEILDIGEYNGLILPRYYNVKKIKGEPKKGGLFIPGMKSDFIREYANLFGMPPRKDRISLSKYKSVMVVGRVKTVTKGYNKRTIHKDLQYSVIGELKKIKEL